MLISESGLSKLQTKQTPSNLIEKPTPPAALARPASVSYWVTSVAQRKHWWWMFYQNMKSFMGALNLSNNLTRSDTEYWFICIYIYYIYTYWYCNLAPKYIQIPQGSTRLGTISTEHGPNNLNPTAISCDHPCWGPFPISTSKAQKLHIKTRSLLWIILMQNDFLQSVFRGNGPRKKLVGKSMVQKRVLTQPQFPVSRYHSSFLSKASPSRSGSGPGLMMYKETMSVNLEAGEKIVRMW